MSHRQLETAAGVRTGRHFQKVQALRHIEDTGTAACRTATNGSGSQLMSKTPATRKAHLLTPDKLHGVRVFVLKIWDNAVPFLHS